MWKIKREKRSETKGSKSLMRLRGKGLSEEMKGEGRGGESKGEVKSGDQRKGCGLKCGSNVNTNPKNLTFRPVGKPKGSCR